MIAAGGRLEVTGRALKSGLPLLGLAPQDQLVVLVLQFGTLQRHDRGRDRHPGIPEAAQGLLDLGQRYQQGCLVRSAAQSGRLQNGQALPGDTQRS